MNSPEFKQSAWARLRGRLFHVYFRFKRPMTLGVRAMLIDETKRQIFLIRHTYVPGWQMPGGGVETGETLREALNKELMEEANIRLTGAPQLFQVYFNGRTSRRDHVALYVCRNFEQTAPRLPDHEIAEAGFFPLDALPPETTRATRARITEVMDGLMPADLW